MQEDVVRDLTSIKDEKFIIYKLMQILY